MRPTRVAIGRKRLFQKSKWQTRELGRLLGEEVGDVARAGGGDRGAVDDVDAGRDGRFGRVDARGFDDDGRQVGGDERREKGQ